MGMGCWSSNVLFLMLPVNFFAREKKLSLDFFMTTENSNYQFTILWAI